jgi:hypothetical protein
MPQMVIPITDALDFAATFSPAPKTKDADVKVSYGSKEEVKIFSFAS